MKPKPIFLAIAILMLSAATFSQKPPAYSYAAQKALIPAELGAVYLGMPVKDFAAKIDLAKARGDGRYGPIRITLPYEKGDVATIEFKIFGVSEADMEKCLIPAATSSIGIGEGDQSMRFDAAKATRGAFVYEIGVIYKKGFDLAALALKKYGPANNIFKRPDEPRIYDMQWTKKTSDHLTWIIRYHSDTNYLQLIGVIDHTEWDPTS